MGPLTGDEWDRAAAAGAEPTAWTPEAVAAAAAAGDRRGSPLPVHLKLDTGMGRLGARPEDVDALVEAAAAAGPGVRVAGLMTHFATADETDGENAGFMAEQLVRFRGRAARPAAAVPGRRGPRRQLGGDPPRPRRRLRHGALRHRAVRLLAVHGRPGRRTTCARPCPSSRTSAR